MNAKMNVPTLQDLYDASWESQVVEGAERLGITPARASIETGSYPKMGIARFWQEPILSGSSDAELPSSINLVKDVNLLSELAWSMSNAIQFPVNTIFAHGLGVVASAMSKSFKFQYRQGEKPVNLYVVTSQPPSTGKSGVNEILGDPVHLAFEAINKTATIERKKAKIRMAAVKREMKNAENKDAQFALEDEMAKLYKQHDKHIVYTYSVDDPTPEGLAKLANKQDGLFNIISAESDAINIILGSVYSDKKANHGLFLKGWDAERVSIVRSSNETMSFKAVGNIAVIAQDESIKTILAAGESGRGISERFLLVREGTFLGKRTFGKGTRIDDNLLAEYSRMIFNIVQDENVILKFSESSLESINDYRREVEPEMGDCGKYSNNMMRGFIGKADKQIMKIASILHVIKNWRDDGDRSCNIEDSTVESAKRIFKEIVNAYVSAADDLGFTGVESEYEKVEEKLQSYASKGKLVITLNNLRGNLKDIKPFTGTPNLTSKLKDVILPFLEDNHICVMHKGKIYINPHMKD